MQGTILAAAHFRRIDRGNFWVRSAAALRTEARNGMQKSAHTEVQNLIEH
jgi:hypothetical protein